MSGIVGQNAGRDSGVVGTVDSVVQVVNVTDGSVATGTTTFGTVGTGAIVQTGGTEFMTLAITPTSASNKLIIRVQAFMTSDTTGKWLIGGLFQDSTSGALASALPLYCPVASPATIGGDCVIHHYMTAGVSGSATTFKFRGGTDNAATTTFNGQSGSVRYADTLSSSMTIWEISV